MIHVEVLERTAKGLQPFVQMPFETYKNDDRWVPPVKKRLTDLLLGHGNEWLRAAVCGFYLAYDGDKAIARVMAGYDASNDNMLGQGVGFISLFEAENADGARAVLDAALAFLKEKGAAKAVGPLYPAYSVLNRGILAEGFDGRPVLENAYNPKEYADYFVANGFEKARDYLAFDIAIKDVELDKLSALAERARQRFGFQIKNIGIQEAGLHLARDIATVMGRALDAEGEVPPTEEDILTLFETVKPVYRGELCVMAYAGSAPIGVVLSFPDNSEYLKTLRGTETPLRRLAALLQRGNEKVLRCPMQAVVPEYQNKAVNLAMICRAMAAAKSLGYERIEGSLVAEDHPSAVNNTRLVGGEIYRKYRVYKKSL